MTNEELLERVAGGDEVALTKLCLMNTGLARDRARLIARRYHCLRQTQHGGLSDYAKEMLSELESMGMVTQHSAGQENPVCDKKCLVYDNIVAKSIGKQ